MRGRTSQGRPVGCSAATTSSRRTSTPAPWTGSSARTSWVQLSARSVRWGYPERLIVGTFGAKALRLPRREEEAPGLVPPAAQARLKKVAAVPRRVKALRVALTPARGQGEPAGSNLVKYSRWYGARGPWCAMFRVLGARTGRSEVPLRLRALLVHDAQRGRNGLSVVHNARARRPASATTGSTTARPTTSAS